MQNSKPLLKQNPRKTNRTQATRPNNCSFIDPHCIWTDDFGNFHILAHGHDVFVGENHKLQEAAQGDIEHIGTVCVDLSRLQCGSCAILFTQFHHEVFSSVAYFFMGFRWRIICCQWTNFFRGISPKILDSTQQPAQQPNWLQVRFWSIFNSDKHERINFDGFRTEHKETHKRQRHIVFIRKLRQLPQPDNRIRVFLLIKGTHKRHTVNNLEMDFCCFYHIDFVLGGNFGDCLKDINFHLNHLPTYRPDLNQSSQTLSSKVECN